MNLLLLPIALAVGVLIGGIGVGGIALPPALTWLFGSDPHTAAGTASLSFLFTGAMGTLMYGRGGAVPWRMTAWLAVGACPAAWAGAAVNGLLPEGIALLPLGLFTLGAGIFHLCFRRRLSSRREQLRAPGSVAAGAAVGFCSALTGTGGPVFLIPVLLALGVPAVTAIAAAQVIQLPLVVFAVAGYAAQGAVDWGAGAMIGIVAAVGAVGGAAIALRLRPRALHIVTSAALLGFGCAITLIELVGP